MISRTDFSVAQVRCAFFNWFDVIAPRQSLFAVDFGETEQSREETINHLWWHFVEILQSVEREQ